VLIYIAHKTAFVIICPICKNWDSHIYRHLVYKHVSKCHIHKKIHINHSFVKNITCLIVSLLRIG